MEISPLTVEVVFDPFEQKIYSGLKTIGDTLAAFYREGVRLVKYDNSEIRSYLIGHILREIDGGIRDVFSSNDVKERISFEYGIPEKKHLADILVVIGEKPDSKFANKWFEMAKTFPEMAHRGSVVGIPRPPEEAITVWNAYQEILIRLIGDYYSFIERIERIAGFEKPPKKIDRVLSNIFKQPRIESVFYRCLRSLEWFHPLLNAGFFDASTVPNLIKVDGGIRFSFWAPLPYLEFVSEEIARGNHSNLSKSLVEIMTNVTDRYLVDDNLDNYFLWNSFLKILTNLPNSLVPIEVLDLIPQWLNSRFDTLTVSADICEHLLPKFLENPNGDDIVKAERLLINILKLVPIERKSDDPMIKQILGSGFQYILNIKPFWLNKILYEEKQLIKNVACLFSDDAINKLFDQILVVTEESDYFLWLESISEMKSEDGYSNQNAFLILFFKNLILKQHEFCPTRLNHLFLYLVNTKKENTLKKKFILFIITLNWTSRKEVFFELIKDKDKASYFSTYKLDGDLYFLLQNAQMHLTKKEAKNLKIIIEHGHKEDEEVDPTYHDYRKLKWYSALRDHPEFTDLYLKLSKEKKLSHEDIEAENKITVKSGDASPLSPEDILKLKTSEILQRIQEFNPDNWNSDFTIRGFAECFGDAIKIDPERFSGELKNNLQLPYIYAAKAISGFKEAWKQHQFYNVAAVFNFIWLYVTQPDFGTEKLKIAHDHWNTNSTWIVKEICELIKAGTDDDSWAFEWDIIPTIIDVITKFINTLTSERFDFPSKATQVEYSLNSAAGQLLTALIYTSLRIARKNRLKKNREGSNWQLELKALYQSTIDKKIIDSFNLQGFFLSQFRFLDRNWIINRIKMNLNVDEELWTGFMQNFLFHRPFVTKEMYRLLKPHYRRALYFESLGKDISSENLARHLLVCYFYDIENLHGSSLILELLINGNHKIIEGVIHFILQQSKFPNVVLEGKPVSLKPKILETWQILNRRFNGLSDKDSVKIMSELTRFVCFVDQLDESNIHLVTDSAKCTSNSFNASFLFEELKKLKFKGVKAMVENYICDIFNAILSVHTPDFRREDIYDLVEFLYASENISVKENAGKICNHYGEKGFDFLRPLWEANNLLPLA